MSEKIPKKDLIVLTDKQELGRRMLMEKNKYTSIMFDGGSRAGKTFVILVCLILFCINYPGLRVLIARLRFAHARASIWEQSLLPLLRKMHIKHHVDKSMFIIRIGKSEIWLGGLDDKERNEKVLGQEYGIVFLNEAVEIPLGSRDVILTRLAQNIEGLINFIIYDCNPRQPTHYLYKEFYGVKKTIDNGVLKFLPGDNKVNLPDGYIEKILEKLPPDKKKRFLKGEWAYLPGAVYHNVNEGCLIKCEQNIYHFYDDIAVGIDWGLHTACVVWGFKRVQNKIQAYCIFEIIILDGTTDELIVELNKFCGIKEEGHILYCDHEPDRIMKLQAAGYMAKNAYKDIASGDDSVNECELFFDETYAKYTFDSMLNLTHPPKPSGEGFIYGKHVKENDHECLVGETLVITDQGDIPIKDIKIGDMVLTRQGYKKVYDWKMTGIKDVYEYKIGTSNIICTDSHKFYCKNLGLYKEIGLFGRNDKFYTKRGNIFIYESCDYVLYRGKRQVYSISVEDAKEYFANGMLCANSDGARYAIHGWMVDNRVKEGGHHILGDVI